MGFCHLDLLGLDLVKGADLLGRGLGGIGGLAVLSVPVILRSTLTVIGRLGSQTPHSHSGEGDRRNGCLLCFGFCLGWWFGIWVSLKHCIAEVEFVISPPVR